MPHRPAQLARREAARKGGGALGKFAEPIPADRAGGTLPKIEQQLVRTKLRPFAAGVVDREPHEIGVVDEGLAAGRQIDLVWDAGGVGESQYQAKRRGE